MTPKEFSNEFDLLYDNASNSAPGLNEYEKSVFLTQAQEQYVISIYSGKIQSFGSFDETQELKKYLDALLVTITLTPNTKDPIDTGSVCFDVPNENLFTVYERALADTTKYKINSITHDEYDYIKENPFRGPLSNRVMSLSKNSNEVELIPPTGVTLTGYLIRYLKYPQPIILTDLTSIGASIHGVSTVSECELHYSTHLSILKIAVDLAVRAYQSQNS